MNENKALANETAPEIHLRKAICILAGELAMEVELAKKDIQKFNKDELIETFIKMKELRLADENLRLINLLLN